MKTEEEKETQRLAVIARRHRRRTPSQEQENQEQRRASEGCASVSLKCAFCLSCAPAHQLLAAPSSQLRAGRASACPHRTSAATARG
jgi:hypothetical protein